LFKTQEVSVTRRDSIHLQSHGSSSGNSLWTFGVRSCIHEFTASAPHDALSSRADGRRGRVNVAMQDLAPHTPWAGDEAAIGRLHPQGDYVLLALVVR
jgi:hypothetical protein